MIKIEESKKQNRNMMTLQAKMKRKLLKYSLRYPN